MEFVTPLSNVFEVRQNMTTREPSLSLPWVITLVTVFTAALVGGIGALASGNLRNDTSKMVLGLVGVDLGALGDLVAIPLLGESIWTVQHPSTSDVIYPRP